MSIISNYYVDHSGLLTKTFAYTIAGYLQEGQSERHGADLVPLENFYRLLEMYRCDSYADEPRKGVLALEELDELQPLSETNWQTGIEAALTQSILESFDGTEKEEAVLRLQHSLRSLAKGELIPADEGTRARVFFERLVALV